MRFIHMADIHLGARPDLGRPWGAARAAEIWESFASVLERARNEAVDLVLIAGDLFHGQPLVRDLKEVDYLFSTLPGQVVLIAGNHDYMKQNGTYAHYVWSDNVHFLGDSDMDRVILDSIGTEVYGFSYHSRELAERRYDNLTVEESPYYKILLAHGGDREHSPFSRELVKKAGFDYIAWGHIHKPRLDMQIPMGFPGSLEPLDETETGSHGYIEGEITDGFCRAVFVPASKREYRSITLTDDGQQSNGSLRKQLSDQIAKQGMQHMYSVLIAGKRNPDIHYDIPYLSCAGNILHIEDRTQPDMDYETLREVHEKDLLGKYIEKLQQTEDPVAQKALEYGTRALMEAMKCRLDH